jgi:hypothetical protein
MYSLNKDIKMKKKIIFLINIYKTAWINVPQGESLYI